MAARTGRRAKEDEGLFTPESFDEDKGRIALQARYRRAPKLRKLPIAGTLDHAFHLVGGREVAIAMSRWAAHKDEQLAELLRIYDEEITPPERIEPGLLERLCLAVGMHPADYFGRVSAAAYRHNFDVAAFTAAVAAPLVIQKSAQFAAKENGFKDRELLLKAAKILEQGSLVQVTQTNQTVAVTGLPKMEELTGRVSDMIRSKEPVALIEGEIVEPEEEAPMGFHIRLDEEKEDD